MSQMKPGNDDLLERQAAKVERLYQQYQDALQEAEQYSALLEEAKTALNRAIQKASLLRDDYNVALAEYVQLQRKSQRA